MRVPENVGRDVELTVSYSGWKTGKVLPLKARLPVGTPDVQKSEELAATLVGHPDWITSLTFSPDGKTLAAGCSDGTVKLWDVTQRKPLAVLQTQRRESLMGWIGGVLSLAFSPNGETLAGAWFHFRTLPKSERLEQFVGDVRMWDVTTGKELATLKGEKAGAIGSIAFSPDGATLAGLEVWMKEPGTTVREVRLWDVADGKLRHSIPGFRGLAFSPNGRHLATWPDSSGIGIWNVDTGIRAASIDGQKTAVTWLGYADGKTLLALDFAGALCRWDARSGEQQGVLIEKVGTLSYPFAVGPDTTMCASVDQESPRQQDPGKVLLWNLRDSKQRVVLRGHTGGVICLAFSPDGKLIASGGVDKTVRLWNVFALEEADPLPNGK